MSRNEAKTVYYASIGPELTLYDIDVDGAALIKRGAVTLPANIQYVWPHPSRRYLYAVSSNGGPQVVGDTHRANALTIDPATGALQMHGAPAALPSRPIHCSVDASGAYLLTAYNNPSNVTVHRLNADGTIGAPVAQNGKLDNGIYAHQILATPSNDTVLLVTRGNDAKPDKPEDPGAIKTFGFDNGALTGLASIAPGTGLGFGPRHLDFHPTQAVGVRLDRAAEQALCLQARCRRPASRARRCSSRTRWPIRNRKVRQAAGAIHVHPSGKFVYLTNRASDLVDLNGTKAFTGGENNVAVFAIDQASGEPTLIQNADGHAVELRTFGIEPSGRMLVAASIKPVPVRDAGGIKTVPAKLCVFHVGSDGKLELKRQYDVDTGAHQQFWSGMVTL